MPGTTRHPVFGGFALLFVVGGYCVLLLLVMMLDYMRILVVITAAVNYFDYFVSSCSARPLFPYNVQAAEPFQIRSELPSEGLASTWEVPATLGPNVDPKIPKESNTA